MLGLLKYSDDFSRAQGLNQLWNKDTATTINVPVLTPQTPSRVQRFKEYAADKRQIFKKYANYKCNSFVNWLLENVPPKPKVIDKVFEFAKNTILKLFPRKKDTFDVQATVSALEGERKPVKREILSSIIFHDSSSIVFGLWG